MHCGIELHDVEASARHLAPFGGKLLRDISPTSQAACCAQAPGQGVVEVSVVSSETR